MQENTRQYTTIDDIKLKTKYEKRKAVYKTLLKNYRDNRNR